METPRYRNSDETHLRVARIGAAAGDRIRPHPSVRGLGAARLLRLSRLLRPRYRNAAHAITRSRTYRTTDLARDRLGSETGCRRATACAYH